MKKLIKQFTTAILVGVMLFVAVGCKDNKDNVKKEAYNYGEYAYSVLEIFDSVYTKRPASSDAEIITANFVSSLFEDIGYETESKPFTYTSRTKTYKSQNIVAVKQGTTSEVVVVGAHYDAGAEGNGVDDNASGVSVMMEVAKFVFDKTHKYTYVFVAFGAEETWPQQGSMAYANALSEAEVKNIKLVINLDSLAAGDKNYVHASTDAFGKQMQQNVLAFGQEKGLAIEKQMGLNPDFPEGTAYTGGDHLAFEKRAIPFLYFESTNWEVGDKDGYTQTEANGPIWHTAKDTLAWLNENYPNRVKSHLAMYSELAIKAITLFE